MSQQAKSYTLNIEEMKRIHYKQELHEIRRKLKDRKYINREEIIFLIHGKLMQDLNYIWTNYDIIFLDLISILNSSRDLLISWVHLSPEGNKKIAHAIYNKLYDIGLLDEELLVY